MSEAYNHIQGLKSDRIISIGLVKEVMDSDWYKQGNEIRASAQLLDKYNNDTGMVEKDHKWYGIGTYERAVFFLNLEEA